MIRPGEGPQQGEDRGSPMSPRLALRVTVVGGIALALFAVIFFRLWYLQVLDSGRYTRLASINITRTISVEAPRGEILGLDGQPLVESDSVPAVSVAPASLPVRVTLTTISSPATIKAKGTDVSVPARLLRQPARDRAIYARLARILGMSTKLRNCTMTVYYTGARETYSHKLGNAPLMSPIECIVAKGVSESDYGAVTVKTGVNADIRAYIDENQRSLQGVIAGQAYQRDYLLGTDGAQLFGYLGSVTPVELKDKGRFGSAAASDSVGQAGLEWEYNAVLEGTDGYEAVKVNSDNEFEGYTKGKAPQIGDDLKTSIDPSLERVGQESLEHSISVNHYGGTEGQAFAGAFVAMDPENGHIYAMGSAPTYRPSIFTGGLSTSQFKYLEDPAHHYPLLDNAIQGVGPDGSTFKVITSTAAMESGAWQPDDNWDDPGYYCLDGATPTTVTYEDGVCRHDSSGESGGTMDLSTAIEVSDDDFFFHLGDLLYHPDGGALQKWEHLFGVGQATGVDLPDEADGSLAGPAFVRALYKQQTECEKHEGSYKTHKGSCSIADTDAWTVGDSLNTALGQGDVQVTPLQLAVIYSAIENGGTIVTPRLAQDVQTQSGSVISRITARAKRHLDIDPTYLAAIQQGLKEAANDPSGTSYDVMHNFGKTVYGKTGTAQYGTTAESAAGAGSDYAWYACYVPSSVTNKPIVVVVWVEGGGFGAVAAAPVARQILSQWYYGKPGPYTAGTSTDA